MEKLADTAEYALRLKIAESHGSLTASAKSLPACPAQKLCRCLGDGDGRPSWSENE